MTTSTTTSTPQVLAPLRQLDDLAHAIAHDGLAAHEKALQQIVAAARAQGLHGPALDALADPARPEVLRERAFAHVHANLRSNPDAAATPPVDHHRVVA